MLLKHIDKILVPDNVLSIYSAPPDEDEMQNTRIVYYVNTVLMPSYYFVLKIRTEHDKKLGGTLYAYTITTFDEFSKKRTITQEYVKK